MEDKDDIQTEIKHVDDMLRHIELVQQNCIILGKKLIEDGRFGMARRLIANGLQHDASKFIGREWEYIKLIGYKKLTKAQKTGVEWAVNQHVMTNGHHSEFWGSIHDMPEVCVIEMICDWKARATEFGTDLREWIDSEATKRYDFSPKDPIYSLIEKYVDMLCGEPLEAIKKDE